MKKTLLAATLVALSALPLAACQNVKQELGVGRNSPDEFMVVKRAPLTLPPDYSLRAPGSGEAVRTQTTETARNAVFGNAAAAEQSAAGSDSSDAAFLDKIGANKAQTDIRNVIDEENGYIALQNKTVGEKLIFWKNEANDDERVPASIINSKAEAERLKKNKEENKPVNDGDVPVIEKKQSTIDKLF